MKVHVVFAHPQKSSFAAAVHDTVVKALRAGGHTVADLDLYRAGFDPRLSAREHDAYRGKSGKPAGIARRSRPLRDAEALVFVFPVWWYGPPAILKGYFDRVWVRGVAYDLKRGEFVPLLKNVRHLFVFTSYGASAAEIRAMGDPVRKIFGVGLRELCSPRARLSWNALYGIDETTPAARRKFLKAAAAQMANL